jgi:cephalosporin hydroxylase
MPEDLRVYEHLLWAGCVDTVIELGSGAGGSALWFHDRLRGFQEQGRSAGAAVISVDIDVSGARANVGERRDIRFVVSTPTGADFELRRDVEAYGLTSNSGGYLRRMG